MDETRRLRVPERFCGPPGVGNGGYVAGLLAAALEDRAEVTLLRPTPLDAPLTLRAEGGEWQLAVGESGEVVATARPAKPALSLIAPPEAPSFDEARAASARANADHPFPGCFVCGPQRAHGDGLRVIAGPLAPGRFERVAAPWVPDTSLSESETRAMEFGERDATREHGPHVRGRFAWAALDCPGAMAAMNAMNAMNGHARPILLARMTGEQLAPVHVGERCVVVGWRIAVDGRKHTTGTALYGEDGGLRGASEQLWIEPRPRAA
jgi:hypothetical protein